MKRYIYKEIPEEATYDNWWNGDVVLEYATTYIVQGGEKPLVVNWTDFSEADVRKIKDKQAELFNKGVTDLLTDQKERFKARYNSSEMKSEYLKAEVQECYNIMFGEVPRSKVVIYKHWGVGLEEQYLLDVQHYINRTIKGGLKEGFGFIHSPNCLHQNTSMPDSRIFAHFVWEYYKWLESFSQKTSSPDEKSLEQIENKIWFKVGLSFANGKIDILKKKHLDGTTPNYTAIARELGNINYRPYISESISNSTKSGKNIFANKRKLYLILEYCTKHNINVVASFKNKLKN